MSDLNGGGGWMCGVLSHGEMGTMFHLMGVSCFIGQRRRMYPQVCAATQNLEKSVSVCLQNGKTN